MATCVSKIGSALGVVMFMGACNVGGELPATEETFQLAEGLAAFSGAGGARFLTKTEHATYLSDRQYVRSLAPRNKAMGINHADPRQHRFAVARMKMAGKTPESSPQLFKMMDDLRAQHTAKGFKQSTMLALATDDGSLQSQHEMLASAKTDASTVSSAALASRRDPLSYGYADCNVYDGLGNGLGDTAYIEIFGSMPIATPRCTGDLAFAQDESIEADSFLSENFLEGNVLQQSYIVGQPVSIAALDPVLSTPTVDQPRDVNGDGVTSVCLDRVWTGDCDLNNTGFATLKLPLKGSISISNGTFDWTKIGQYQRGQDSGSAIYVTLQATTGGGCKLPVSSQTFAMADFWKSVTGTATQLNWDLYTDLTKWAQFSSSCRLVRDRVDLTMSLQLPYLSPSFGGNLSVEISTLDGQVTAPNYQITPFIRVTNSCLAAGTRVLTPAGETQNIEDLHIGDRVFNPHAASLTVTDTSVGTEPTPMVHIFDNRGRDLLMTETHPIYVVDRGMVPAKQLRTGDLVRTQDGASQLVRVTREAYHGKVYNVKIGDSRESHALGVDQTVLFANGFLVGDGQIQDKYEVMDRRQQAVNDKAPMRWKQDYETSLRRAGRMAH